MSCFVHHMINKGIFNELGVIVSEENADDMEKKITKIVGLSGKDCSTVWKEVSKRLENPRLRRNLKSQLSQ